MSCYSIELAIKIYNDETGERIEVTEDADGLGLIEIISVDENQKITNRFAFEPEIADGVVDAIIKIKKSIEDKHE